MLIKLRYLFEREFWDLMVVDGWSIEEEVILLFFYIDGGGNFVELYFFEKK